MKKEKQEVKMTLDEYKSHYSKPQNIRTIRTYVTFFFSVLLIAVIYFLFSFTMKLFEINQYAGYVGAVLSVLIFIFLILVPVFQIKKYKPFEVNLYNKSAKQAQKHNKALRQEIALHMVDIVSKTKDLDWYSNEKVGDLAIALTTRDDEALKKDLTTIFNTDVKASSERIIKDHALKIGVTTALSQSERLDTLFMVVFELNLVKDLVYLYGYRPSDAKLLKIYRTVITNALTAYGLESFTTNLATGVAKKVGDLVTAIPVLGEAVGLVVGSSIDGLVNSTLTVAIGIQTKKYLMEEYKLQDVLDGITVSDEEDQVMQEELITELRGELTKYSKKKKYKPAEASL